MKNKLILQFVKDDIITKNKEYKSIMAISKDFPEIEYHQLREIYLISTKKVIRKLQKFNANLYNKIRIIDNPDYYNCIKPNLNPLNSIN
jgi:hypothetical protein